MQTIRQYQTIDWTIQPEENGVLCLQDGCIVEVSYKIDADNEIIYPRIETFIFEGDERTARIKRGHKFFAAFDVLTDSPSFWDAVDEQRHNPPVKPFTRSIQHAKAH